MQAFSNGTSKTNFLMRQLLFYFLLCNSLLLFANGNKHFNKIPGLYEQTELIKPIQGAIAFEELISPGKNESILPLSLQRIAIIQFYMETCPHCQGFAPYFRRFVQDIGPHWHKLMQTFVVNCVDDLNIDVCWTQSTDPFVPSMRWSSVPELLESVNTKNLSLLEAQNLSWSHRKKIEKSRRDLISLRHTTLDFMREQANQMHLATESFEQIPLKWLLLESLIPQSTGIQESLLERSKICLELWQDHISQPIIDNFVIFERADLYAARTAAADWSNFTCSQMAPSNSPNRLMMVHYAPIETDQEQSLSIALMSYRNDKENSRPILFDKQVLLLPNEDQNKTESSQQETTSTNTLASLLTLTNNAVNQQEHQPTASSTLRSKRNAAKSMQNKGHRRHISGDSKSKSSPANQLDLDDVNWVPGQFFAGEEHSRWLINRIIRDKVIQLYGLQMADLIPLVGHEEGNPGEIIKPTSRDVDPSSIMPAKADDLTPMRLTDYYKVLGQLVNRNILFKKEIDGNELIGSTCFLDQLVQHFPFQGGRDANHHSNSKKFLKLLQQEQLKMLNDQFNQLSSNSNETQNPIILVESCRSHDYFKFDNKTQDTLNSMRFLSSKLQEKQRQLRRDYDVGLADEAHFTWQYCKGSKDYLRGHTCALWVMFHTLTVHDYIHSVRNETSQQEQELDELKSKMDSNDDDAKIYKYTINYKKNQHRAQCDPQNPEPAYLNATSQELFVDGPKFTLANIINFVRYYLPCTNCAAHFNCMVKHSDIDFEQPKPGDHLLWVWEAHNRVNLRTKNTYSEDPTRPKHIFPNYEACPECYVTKPDNLITGGGDLDAIKFYRKPVIDFLVARYRRAAILNNKIRIEDLFRKPPPNAQKSK